VQYEKEGFLTSQRALVTPWRDYAWLPDVVMIPFDTAVTAIDLGAAATQVARANAVSDADGTRLPIGHRTRTPSTDEPSYVVAISE
jgi:hypothetical protein